ncbi:MAG: hypothetical protein MJA30_11835 [Cytophagales bacterium]|nr:hypothetical protein [Cytophagales bacterium]
MKKKIKPYVSFILIFTLTTVIAQNISVAPDGKTYTNFCSVPVGGTNGIDYWDAWFNDQDSDCHSHDWYVEYHTMDGEIQGKSDEYWRNVYGLGDAGVTINFGTWHCCDHIIGRACNCEWEFHAITNTLTIDCSTCNGGGGMD